MPFIVTCVVSLFFGLLFQQSQALRCMGPASYWTIIYPAALVLSVILGAVLKSSQWSAGGIVMLSQIPVVLATSGTSPLLAAGIVIAAFLSIPAIALSWLRRQMHSGKKGRWTSAKK